MFEDGECPMLLSDVIHEYSLSDSFVRKFCSYGCSMECGRFLEEHLEKKGMKPLHQQGSAAPVDDKTAEGGSG